MHPTSYFIVTLLYWLNINLVQCCFVQTIVVGYNETIQIPDVLNKDEGKEESYPFKILNAILKVLTSPALKSPVFGYNPRPKF